MSRRICYNSPRVHLLSAEIFQQFPSFVIFVSSQWYYEWHWHVYWCEEILFLNSAWRINSTRHGDVLVSVGVGSETDVGPSRTLGPSRTESSGNEVRWRLVERRAVKEQRQTKTHRQTHYCNAQCKATSTGAKVRWTTQRLGMINVRTDTCTYTLTVAINCTVCTYKRSQL